MTPRALLLSLLGGLLSLSACSDKEPEPQTIPVSSAAQPAAVAADPASSAAAPAAPAGSEAAAAPTTPTPDTPATAPPTGAKVGGASIDACCSGLLAINSSGRSPEAKSRANTAYKLCTGLAKRVKEGQVTKATAIATIKGTLGDVSAPPECK